MTAHPLVLTIAGTDPSGGAGIQADLRAFQFLGVTGTSVITAALAQNSTGVTAIHYLPPRIIEAQIDAVAKDAPIAAVKIGMLGNERIVSAVSERITRRKLPNVVLDPVLAAKDGRVLLTPRGIRRLISDLLPKTLIVTPNVPEAAALAQRAISTLDEAREAARIIHGHGARWVIVKGGHWADDTSPIDLVFDGETFVELAGDRIPGPSVRGTGCLFSASLAAYIALGTGVLDAAVKAKSFVARAITDAAQVGKGHRIWSG
ncbi:MAG TPA: bifunctional hydroxymethylpyrimidine kinase/phosphomethylpyrimidine kinase [Armatimonadota bacterium]|jgi:hydroxymethylpyrimidine/phosphomethylpyrimidine kinase